MIRLEPAAPFIRKRSYQLRVGFVPLTDAAPLVLALTLGLFAKHGLEVRLSRELGWATIRDKIVYGELDAAHAVAGMPFAVTLGLNCSACDCLTGLVLNLHGNAITLSMELWEKGVRDGATLQRLVQELRPARRLIFGIVSHFSSHEFLMRQWLTAHNIDPDRDVRLVVVPPPYMVTTLKTGHLDGFCVGEPWNSAAVESGKGWVAATSSELAPGHPEKVLIVRRCFAEARPDEHRALLAALLEACEFCDQPANRDHVVSALAQPEYLGAQASLLRRGLLDPFDFGHGRVEHVFDFHLFHQNQANEPTPEKASWVMRQLEASGRIPDPARLNPALGRQIFRADLFEQASQLLSRQTHPHAYAPTNTQPRDIVPA